MITVKTVKKTKPGQAKPKTEVPFSKQKFRPVTLEEAEREPVSERLFG